MRLILAGLALLVPATAAAQAGAWRATGSMTEDRVLQGTAVLNDGRVLVVGGSDDTLAELATAEIFDPATGTWSKTSSLPYGVSSATLTTLLDGRVLLAGGYLNPPNAGTNRTWIWDPATGAWTEQGVMVSARYWHTATLLRDGRVLVTLGCSDSPGPCNTYPTNFEVFDPANGMWSPAGSTTAGSRGRHSPSAVLLDDGRVLIAGGSRFSGVVEESQTFVDIWDAGVVSNGTDLPSRRTRTTATRLADGNVLVAGGFIAQGIFVANPLNTAVLWDKGTGAWTATTNTMNTPRRLPGSYLRPDGKVVVLGGDNSGASSAPLATLELYDPSTNSWSVAGTLSSMAQARILQSVVPLPGGRVLVSGGENGASSRLNTAEIYDPLQQQVSSGNVLTSGRRNHSLTATSSGAVAIGGCSDTAATCGSFVATAESWDRATSMWSAAGSMTAARQAHASALLATGDVLVTGGHAAAGVTATVERWTAPSTFAGRMPMTNARQRHSAVTLGDGRVLVAGGCSDPACGSFVFPAEVYDPAANTWSGAGNLSAARADMAATLLLDGRAMFAGGNDGFPNDLVSLWDPGISGFVGTASLSVPRWMHTATRLADGRVLVTGGCSANPCVTPLASTEIWDPATGTWTASGPLAFARIKHTATPLPDGRVLVSGGCSTGDCSASPGEIEIWDPATGVWLTSGALTSARREHRSSALADGRVLISAGLGAGVLTSTEVWAPRDPATVPMGCAPALGLLVAGNWTAGEEVSGAYQNARGCSEGTGGILSTRGHSDLPQARIVSLADGSLWTPRQTVARSGVFGTPTTFTFTVPGDAGMAPGPHALTLWQNGLSSAPYVTTVDRNHDKYYFHREKIGSLQPRVLSPLSPLSNAGGHYVGPRDPLLCASMAVAGPFRIEVDCNPVPAADDEGRFVHPQGATGYPVAQDVAGAWTVRADVRASGAAGGSAFLYARVMRNSDGVLIHETERAGWTELGSIPAGQWREVTLPFVIRPRATDGAGFASTTIPMGDRVRVEVWLDVRTVNAARTIELATEAPGSTAASMPLLNGAIGPLRALVSRLRARALGDSAEIAWTVEEPAEIVSMQVERTDGTPVGSAISADGIGAEHSVLDSMRESSWVLRVTTLDGSVETYGPVSLQEDGATSCACNVGLRESPGAFLLALAVAALWRRRHPAVCPRTSS